MKKFFCYILTLALSLSLLTGIPSRQVCAQTFDWPKGPDIYAQTGVLIDASTGTILYDKKCHKKMYPASITKIMTALLTIENCSMDEEVVFSENAVNSLVYGDANFACQVGEKMSVKECLYVLMLQSANEVATALAEHISGSVEEFAKLMNERAKKAGALDTHFMNANGLHNENHYVTAYDMAMITRAAASYDIFNEIVNTTQYTVSKNNKRKTRDVAIQRHKMVWPASGYYYDDVIGGKTGYTDQSGTTLVTYAKRNGMMIISVVLKSNGANVYNDTSSLLDYGFNNFNLKNVSKNDSRFMENTEIDLKSPFIDSTSTICLDPSSNVVIPKGADFSSLKTSIDYNLSGNSFATVTYSYGDKSVGSAKILYEKSTVNTEADKTASVETKVETTPDTDNTISGNDNNSSDSQDNDNESFKLPGFVLPLTIVAGVLILIIILINIQRRRLNRIREMKRHRHR